MGLRQGRADSGTVAMGGLNVVDSEQPRYNDGRLYINRFLCILKPGPTGASNNTNIPFFAVLRLTRGMP